MQLEGSRAPRKEDPDGPCPGRPTTFPKVATPSRTFKFTPLFVRASGQERATLKTTKATVVMKGENCPLGS